MGRYEYFCPVTGQKTTVKTATSESAAPRQFFAASATRQEIAAYEARCKDRGEESQFHRQPHQEG